MVTGLGKQRIIFGFPWFKKHNPDINWNTGVINWRIESTQGTELTDKQKQQLDTWNTWRKGNIRNPTPHIEEIEDEDQGKNRTTNPIIMETPNSPISDPLTETSQWIKMTRTPETKQTIPIFSLDLYEDDGEEVEEVWIYAKTTLAMDLAIKENLKKDDLTDEQMIPPEYHQFLDVFSEQKAARFPESRPWDHKIEMKDGFEPKSFKNYNLTPEEQIELDKFLKENIDKGYIRNSQSPMASPFFFVKKKDGKLRPCQDYRYLNEWNPKRLPTPTHLQNIRQTQRRQVFYQT